MHSAIGTVKKIIYASHEKQIISLATKDKSIRVLFSEEWMHVEKGDHIRVRGQLTNCLRYGQQLISKEVDYTPVTHELISDFIRSGTGVGNATSERLLSAFPEDLIHKIQLYDIDALSSIPRISKALATTICNNWRSQGGKIELIQFMDNVLNRASAKNRSRLRRAARKAFAVYQEDTVEKIKEDPYRIWAFSSFSEADCLALAMNIALSDPRRLICAVEEILFRHLSTGSTRVTPTVFATDLSSLLGSEELMLKALYEAIKAAEEGKERIVISEHDDPSLSELERLYTRQFALPGATIMENYVSVQLKKRLANNIIPIQVAESELCSYTLPNGHGLTNEQTSAVQLVLNNAVSVISGGGGVGKTSVLYCANDMIKKSGNDVLQVALSGKASQRLIQQTEDDAFTIAALLQRIEIEPNFLDRYRTPVVHIDEASMVDLQSMYRILTVFEGRPLRLVFIGDWAQLAPVGIGLIFHKLMTSDIVPKIELTKNFRSNKGIKQVSDDIKAGRVFEPNSEVQIISYFSQDELMSLIERQYYLSTYNEAEAHIIAPRKTTVSAANVRIHNALSKGRKPIIIAPQFREQEQVIYKKNDADLGLVNGSTGVITGQTETSMIVKFIQEGVKSLGLEHIQKDYSGEYILQHAYALTCHSSQGSEFDTAIIVVEDFDMVERSWLYTAVTRAKKKVILLEKEGAIKNALDRGFGFEKIMVGFDL
jgi:exodeoxyribonuclease V alpha subunit